jgi:chaperone LolA
MGNQLHIMDHSMLYRFITLVLFSAIFVAPVHAGVAVPGITAQEIIEKVQSRYEKMSDATIVFKQSVRHKVSKSEQSTAGTLYFKKKNKYRIETEDRIIVTNGVVSWSYTPSRNQVVIDNYKEQSHSLSPEQLLLKYPDDYYSTVIGEEKVLGETCHLLKLTPKEDNSYASALKIWISPKWMIRKVEVLDLNGAVTTYLIKEFTIDKGISDSKFEFKAPAGVNTIDLR